MSTRPIRAVVAAALLIVCAVVNAPALPDPSTVYTSSSGQRFRVTVLATGLEQPWGLAPTPDGRILLTERPGRLRVVRGGVLDPAPVAGLPVITSNNQGGLLDVVLHPDYATNRRVYLAYVVQNRVGEAVRVASFVDNTQTVGGGLTDRRVVFRNAPVPNNTVALAFGGRLAFGRPSPEGGYFLFIAAGDRYTDPNRAQNPANLDGKILRILDDGRIPSSNPFVNTPGYKPQIFSLGHRNPQGLAFQPRDDGSTGVLWASEHGSVGGDEINIIRPGRNYGWPVIRGPQTAPGLVAPVRQFTRSIAPSGMTFLAGDRYPTWKGNLFVGCLVGERILRVEVAGGAVQRVEALLLREFGRIRDLAEGPDGTLYFITGRANQDAADVLARIDPVP
jgi:aldose sugar dehydrogenase